MTIQQLEYIKALDRYRNFGLAADACGVTQPTLSLMIKKLEEEFDIQIFDRQSHPVKPTEAGRRIIDKASIILFNVKQLEELVKDEKKLSSGQVNIAMISTIAPIIIPRLFKHLSMTAPQVEPIMQEMLSSTILDKLKKAEIDIGLMRSPVSDASVLEIPLFHEKFLAYVSPDHPLYSCREIDSEILLDHPIWIIKDGIRQFDKSMLTPGSNFHYDTMYEGGRVGNLVNLVNETGGITIIPEMHTRMLAPEMIPNLRPIVNPPAGRIISLVIRKDYTHETMLNIIIDGIKTIIPAQHHEDMIRAGRIKL